MTGVLAAALAAYGTFLLFTSLALGWRGLGPGPRADAPRRPRLLHRTREWMTQAGLGRVALGEFVVVLAVVFVLGAAIALVLFGGPVPALVTGIFAASFPLAAYRQRRTSAAP